MRQLPSEVPREQYLRHTYWVDLQMPSESENRSVCPALCDPVEYTVHGILEARILEWVAFPFSRGSTQPRDQSQVSLMARRFFTSWATRENPHQMMTVSTQAPDPLEPKEPPPTNQRTVRELITNPTTPLPLRLLNALPWNWLRSSGVLRTSCPGPLACCRALSLTVWCQLLALLCTGEWTQVWVGNTSSTKLPPSTGNVSRRGRGGWKHFKHLISNLASRCQHLSQKWVIA